MYTSIDITYEKNRRAHAENFAQWSIKVCMIWLLMYRLAIWLYATILATLVKPLV